jgi:hypothetical protein
MWAVRASQPEMSIIGRSYYGVLTVPLAFGRSEVPSHPPPQLDKVLEKFSDNVLIRYTSFSTL